MCIGCIVSALTRTFEWKMALLSRITAVLYSTPSSLFDHGRRVYSVFPFFSPPRKFAFLRNVSFAALPIFYLHLTYTLLLFTPYLQSFDGVRSFEGLVRWFENWKSLEGFFVIRVRSILHREYFWRDSGKFEKFKWIKWWSYLFFFFFFWQRIKRWSQFSWIFNRNKRFRKKKEKKK